MDFTRFNAPAHHTLLTPEQVIEYSAAAEKYYTVDYAYHNWDHAQAVVEGTNIITGKLEAKNIVVAKRALVLAAAWHDAGYHEDHLVKGFATKELYSAALLDQFLEDKPVGDGEKRLMRLAIVATWAGHTALRTPYELILHRSDIANIGGPTELFIENSVKLWKEFQYTTGTQISWDDYVRNSTPFIQHTASEHDIESLGHGIHPDDTTIDVYNTPYKNQALLNLAMLQTLQQ